MSSAEEKLNNLRDAFNAYKESESNNQDDSDSASSSTRKQRLLDAYLAYNSTSVRTCRVWLVYFNTRVELKLLSLLDLGMSSLFVLFQQDGLD